MYRPLLGLARYGSYSRGMAITTSLTDELAAAWVTGRVRIGNYHRTTRGNIHAALRTPESAAAGEDVWEYVVTNADHDVLKAIANEIIKHPTRQLIVGADIPKEPHPAGATAKHFAEKNGLRPIGVQERAMDCDVSQSSSDGPTF